MPHLLMLRTQPGDRRHPGKSYALRDGRVDKAKPARITAYAPYPIPMPSTVEGLGRVLHAVAGGEFGPGFLILGGLSHPGAAETSRRKSAAVSKEGDPEGYIVDMATTVSVADADGWPNLRRFTARQSDDAARWIARHVRTACPDAGAVVAWSSSAFLIGPDGRPLGPDEVPATLSAHVWMLWTRPVAESERKVIVGRHDAAVRASLAAECRALGLGESVIWSMAKVLDPAAAIYQQPIYELAPRLAGLDDPVAGRRHIVLPGAAVDPDALAAACPEPVAKAVPAKAKKARPDGTVARAAARALATPLPALTRADIDFIDRRIAALATQAKRLWGGPVPGDEWQAEDWEASGFLLHQARRVRDIVRLVEGRRADGVAGWEHGIPEGHRNTTLTIIGSDLSCVCPGGWSEAAPLLRAIGHRLVGAYITEWMDGDGRAACLAARAAEAKAGVTRTLIDSAGRERVVDARMTYSRRRVAGELGVTEAEMIRYGLGALRSEAVRAHQRRRDRGVPSMKERRAKQAATSAEALKPWEAEGVSRATWYRRRAAVETPRDRLLAFGSSGAPHTAETGTRKEGEPGVDARPAPPAVPIAVLRVAPVDPAVHATDNARDVPLSMGHEGAADEARPLDEPTPSRPGSAEDEQAHGRQAGQAWLSEPEEMGRGGAGPEGRSPWTKTEQVIRLPAFVARRAAIVAPAPRSGRPAADVCLVPGPLFASRRS
ncbi:hypothetical protein [Azospirillum sp. TSO22-1]|uniref:hypothetical protein n=1 Tax=Azospirillum sp. TSO22-1 TaxID=716789 RepID=UPI000D61D424|nr:hypothetical protein [Azospirillum sp. TSO22-1]PWC45874.1 hypothetical protein TSO221_15075 [Azospirillum sp. TSO22-1]